MVKAILFDADGVLIRAKLLVSSHLANDYGITTKITSDFFNGIFVDCVNGKADLKEVLPPYLKEWGWKGSVDEFLDYWHRSEHTIDTHLVDYIKELKKKNIICCLTTNQAVYRFEYMLNEMGFSKVFDKVYCSANLKVRKPEVSFYRKVFEDLGLKDKKEVLFWDDDASNIEGAKLFGIYAELYTDFNDFTNKMKMYV